MLLVASGAVLEHSSSQLQPDDVERADPRLRKACRHFHGKWGAGTNVSLWSVRTAEDVVAKRTLPHPLHKLRARFGTCDLPYGHFLNRSDDETSAAFWVEVPKTGSTTVRSRFPALKPISDDTSALADGSVKSFVVVREPLQRMLSGYGTLQARLQLELPRAHWPEFLHEEDEPTRFTRFVDLLVSTPDIELAHSACNVQCIWQHVMTQMWFISLFPAEITFLARTEHLDEDLPAAANAIGARYEDAPSKNANEGGLNVTQIALQAPSALARLLTHLAQDYECLGYPVPSPEHLSTQEGTALWRVGRRLNELDR